MCIVEVFSDFYTDTDSKTFPYMMSCLIPLLQQTQNAHALISPRKSTHLSMQEFNFICFSLAQHGTRNRFIVFAE